MSPEPEALISGKKKKKKKKNLQCESVLIITSTSPSIFWQGRLLWSGSVPGPALPQPCLTLQHSDLLCYAGASQQLLIKVLRLTPALCLGWR